MRVSEAVLDAISSALKMSVAERAHLYRLAGLNPPQPKDEPDVGALSLLARIAGAWQPAPAYVIDRHWKVIAANDSAEQLLGVRADGQNFLDWFFTDSGVTSRYLDWERVAERFVGQFRAQAARFPNDSMFPALAARLSDASPMFATLWDRQEVCGSAAFPLGLRTRHTGPQTYEYVSLGMFEGVEVSLAVYLPQSVAAPKATHRLLAG